MKTTSEILILTLILLFLTVKTQPASSQTPAFYGPPVSDIFSISDHHFRGILFPEVYKLQTSTKVNYPGLWTPDKSSVTIGFLPTTAADRFGPPLHPHTSTHGLNSFYGQTDIDISPGSAGFWLGNLNYSSGFRVSEYFDLIYSWDTREFSMRGAFWLTPFNHDLLRGISVAAEVNNAYAFNGNEHEGLFHIRQLFLNINALFKISPNYHLRVGLRTFNRHADDPEDTRFDNRRLFTDGLTVGVLDGKMRTLDFRAENSFAMNYADEKSDTVSIGLRFTQGWVTSYRRQMLFAGVRADASVSWPSEISDEAGSFQYMYYLQNLTGAGRTVRASGTVPIALDIDLTHGIRFILSVSPRAEYTHIAAHREPVNSTLYLQSQHRFTLTTPEAVLSVRGVVGERFDFAAKPSLNSNVLLSALEIRYRF
jgi:hypothetical protein